MYGRKRVGRGPIIGAILVACVVVWAPGASVFAADSASQPVQPPGAIQDSARAHVIAKVGEEFFSKYLRSEAWRYSPGAAESTSASGGTAATGPSADESAHHLRSHPWAPSGPLWTARYALSMPTKPWVWGEISLSLDSTGALVDGIHGACDCASHPASCEFGVDESAAITAAKQAGLAPGVRPWKAQFQWVAIIPFPCYAWVISNTKGLEADSCSGRGKSMIIDASTGKALKTYEWVATCDFIQAPNLLPREGERTPYDTAPIPIARVAAVYPQFANEAGIRGDVIVHVLVGLDGRVKNVKLIKGVTGLNDAALSAVKKWTYRPAMKDNKPVAVWIEETFHFPP